MAKRKRTPEENHDALYTAYVTLNATEGSDKVRTPSTPEIQKRFENRTRDLPVDSMGATEESKKLRKRLLLKALDDSVQARSKAEEETKLQGNCTTADDKTKNKAFSTDKDEQKEFIDSQCSTCPVKLACLNYALERHSDEGLHGIWGGTTENEREGYRRSLQEGLTTPLDTPWFPKYQQP